MTEARSSYQVAPRPRRRRAGRCLPNADATGFPGCDPVPMDADEFDQFERHVEHWDSRSGIAWMVRETSVEHERPSMRLAVLVHRMAQIRGAEIACCGTVSLHDTKRDGSIRAMEPDQSIYMDASRAQALISPVLVQGGEIPDIALEVDFTTDARRRKIGIYEEWRIPEIWVEVPDAPSRTRPRSRQSGLTIYALDAKTGTYRTATKSAMLTGWTTAEIHIALNEATASEGTWSAVNRVGRTLGRQEGTNPSEDPLLSLQLQEARAAEGQERLADVAYAILAQRGIQCPPGFLADELLTRHATAHLVEAALACESAEDFLARL